MKKCSEIIARRISAICLSEDIAPEVEKLLIEELCSILDHEQCEIENPDLIVGILGVHLYNERVQQCIHTIMDRNMADGITP